MTAELESHEFTAGIPGAPTLGDVTLRAAARVGIAKVFVVTSVRRKSIQVETELDPAAVAAGGSVHHSVWTDGRKVLSLPGRDVPPGASGPVTVEARWSNPLLWDLRTPHLYQLRSEWRDSADLVLDRVHTRFGFREFRVSGTEFLLNGRVVRIQGDSSAIVWYFTPVRHRFLQRTHSQFQRAINSNLLRLHVSGMTDRVFCDVADETGMLVTLESPTVPFAYVTDDQGELIPGRLKETTDQYRRWARRFRNRPSVVTYSLFNEFWSNPTEDPQAVKVATARLGVLKKLNDVVLAADPNRLAQLHGAEGAFRQNGVPWLKVTNLHYQWQSAQTANWRRDMRNRPLIIGEIAFEGTWSFFNSALSERRRTGKPYEDFYWDKVRATGNRIGSSIALYRQRGISGIMPYEILQWATNPTDPRGWCNDLATIEWPALSGPGQKPPRSQVGSAMRHMNWTDPAWPKAPRNPFMDSVADAFAPQPMPSWATLREEVIVLVRKAGQPQANVPVMLYPGAGQAVDPVGSVTDAAGKAWIVVPEGGEYRALVSLPDGSYEAAVMPRPLRI